MADFIRFDVLTEHLAEEVHNLEADTLKVMLTDTAPVIGNTVKADLVEITAGNGYTAGGAVAPVVSAARTGGVWKLVLADVVFTASGGSIGPFRYVVLYNDTPTDPADPLIGWWDYNSSITLADGETLTVDFDPDTGVLQIS